MGVGDRLTRVLGIAGLVLMILGALDPLEGSVVIVAGAAAAAVAAWRARDQLRGRAYWAFFMVGVGVALLFGMSALGGVGGNSGRSIWWLLILLPYPVGWGLGVVTAVKMLRRSRAAHA